MDVAIAISSERSRNSCFCVKGMGGIGTDGNYRRRLRRPKLYPL